MKFEIHGTQILVEIRNRSFLSRRIPIFSSPKEWESMDFSRIWKMKKGKGEKLTNPKNQESCWKQESMESKNLVENRNPKNPRILLKTGIEVFSQEDSNIFRRNENPWISLFLESEKGKREKLTKSKEPKNQNPHPFQRKNPNTSWKGIELGIRRSDKGFLSRRFGYFPKEWESIDFSLFGKWKREKGKWEIDKIPKSKEPRIFMKFENHGIQILDEIRNRSFLSRRFPIFSSPRNENPWISLEFGKWKRKKREIDKSKNPHPFQRKNPNTSWKGIRYSKVKKIPNISPPRNGNPSISLFLENGKWKMGNWQIQRTKNLHEIRKPWNPRIQESKNPNPWKSMFSLEFEKNKREKKERREKKHSHSLESKKEPRIFMKSEIHVFLSRRIRIFPQGMENHGFLSFWKGKKGKWEIDKIPKSQETTKNLHENRNRNSSWKGIRYSKVNKGFLSRRFRIFSSQGMENHPFLSFRKWTKERKKNREKFPIPNSQFPRKNPNTSWKVN